MATRTAMKHALLTTSVIAILFSAVFLVPEQGQAIPAFARQYQTSCTTCHSDFPKLNDFGKAFKDAGFKFPKDDETFIKVPPTMLGAEQQKQLWPKVVWPGSIPGMPPIGLRMNTFFQVVSRNRGLVNASLTPGTVPQFFTPRSDFQTGLFSIFTAGNFGSGIAFWVDDDLSVAGSGADGGLGDGYLKFVDLGHLLKLPTDSLSLRFGQFELDLPFSPARTHNLSGWDIFDQTNIGTVGLQNVSNNLALGEPGQGVEISGGHTYGGYHYSIAVVNQRTSGEPNNDAGFVSPVTGFFSDSNFKDVYARFSYRFNLERDRQSRTAIQAAGATGPRDHTYLNLGTFYYYGRSVQRFSGAVPILLTPTVLTAREPFYRTGGDFSFNYRNFNFYGVFMYGRDHNLVPLDDLLNPFPAQPTHFVRGTPVTFTGGFLQADYMPLPWIMLIMRYDAVNSTSDRSNSLAGESGSFPGAFDSTRNRFTPGVQFLIRSNIKAAFEYQYRPRQTVIDAGTLLPIQPFRTNSAVVGLDFVY